MYTVSMSFDFSKSRHTPCWEGCKATNARTVVLFADHLDESSRNCVIVVFHQSRNYRPVSFNSCDLEQNSDMITN